MKETIEMRLMVLQDHVKLKVNFCRRQADFFEDWGKVYFQNKEASDAYQMAADNLRFIAGQLDDAWQLSKSEWEETT